MQQIWVYHNQKFWPQKSNFDYSYSSTDNAKTKQKQAAHTQIAISAVLHLLAACNNNAYPKH